MRHIKRFNESNIDALEELKDFCESNLAFLLDEEYIIYYTYYKSIYKYAENETKTILNPVYSVQIANRNINSALYWDEMKDYIIPFLERLSNNYTLHSLVNDSYQIYIGIKYIDQSISVPQIILREYSYNNIINDKINIDDKIHSITIQVQI